MSEEVPEINALFVHNFILQRGVYVLDFSNVRQK